MTTDDILRMAREAGLSLSRLDDDYCTSAGLEIGTICRINDVGFSELERFAALVAAAEREACAKVCEYRAMALDYSGNQYVRDHAALDCARSIRARGKT